MKKHTCYLALAAITLSISSCKKSFTCQCTMPFTWDKQNVTVKAKNETNAKAACAYMGKDAALDGPFDCHLID